MVREKQEHPARWRVALGLAVLGALIFFCVLLVNPYVENWRLQQYIEQAAHDPAMQSAPPEAFAAAVADRAASLGIPLPFNQVRVTRSANGTFVEARYFVRVDLKLYTVDLHFRPSAGAR